MQLAESLASQLPTQAGPSAETGRLIEEPGAPPWLYLWAVSLLCFGAPELGAKIGSELGAVALARASAQRLEDAGTVAPEVEWLFYVPGVFDVLPPAVLLASLTLVAVPWIRTWLVERRSGLLTVKALPQSSRHLVEEIEGFVRRRDARITVKVNLLRARGLAFVYPCGYRGACLAVFGGMVRLWHADRAAAEAVLLHELAHHRRGDSLILGPGSLFEGLVRSSVFLMLIGIVLPLTVVRTFSAVDLAGGALRLGVPSAQAVTSIVTRVLTFDVPMLVLACANYAFIVLRSLVVPVAAIWIAELGADRFVLSHSGGSEALRRALVQGSGTFGRVGWLQWVLFQLSHPPTRLRLWLANQPDQRGLLWLLLMLPAAHLVRLIVLHAYAVVAGLRAGLEPAGLWENAVIGTIAWLTVQPITWGSIAVSFLVWPVLYAYWSRSFSGMPVVGSRRFYPVYVACAVLTSVVAVVGWLTQLTLET